MSEYSNDWRCFLSIIFSPYVVVPTLIAILFGYWAFTTDDTTTKAVGSVIMAILSGYAGAQVNKTIVEKSEINKLSFRGKSAVRGLNLIFLSLGTLESQLEDASTSSEDKNSDLMYMKSLCINIQRQVINSIQEWSEILPNSSIVDIVQDKIEKTAIMKAQTKQVPDNLNNTPNSSVTEKEDTIDSSTRITNTIYSTLDIESAINITSIDLPSSLDLISPSTGSNLVFDSDGIIHIKDNS